MGAGNYALYENPPAADINITTHGSDWYWAVTALFALSTIIFGVLSLRKARAHRIFHYLTVATLALGTITYFTLASNLGSTPVRTEFRRNRSGLSGATRQFYYARWIFYFLAFPLVLLKLMLTSTVHWTTILYTIFLQETFVVSLLIGALIPSGYKWGYFLIGLFALVATAYHLLFSRKAALTAGSDVAKHFTLTSGFATLLWLLYPIAWGVSQGGNYIHPDSEGVFYGVLDIFLFLVLGALFHFGHRNIDPERLGHSYGHGNRGLGHGTHGNNAAVGNNGTLGNNGALGNNGTLAGGPGAAVEPKV